MQLPESFHSDLPEVLNDLRDTHQLEEARLLFTGQFQQAWRDSREPGFAPALAELRATDEVLHVLAVLGDHDIHNSATGFNEKTWQTGDVFEIFIQTDADTYYEFHITPENRHLFLAWTTESFSAHNVGKTTLEAAMIEDRNFLSSETRIRDTRNHWTVVARIPYTKLGINPANPPAELKVAFARYDASRDGSAPILSATPDFPQASYHQRDYWHALTLHP